MEEKRELTAPREPVRFGNFPGRGTRRFLAFTISCAILVAAFAAGGIWMNRNDFPFRDLFESFLPEKESPSGQEHGVPEDPPGEPSEEPPEVSPEQMPAGAVPVVSMDLSGVSLGADYIQNETCYLPDIAAMRNATLPQASSFDPADGPVVLILHTHATEAYLPAESAWLTGEVGDAAYSSDPQRSVIAVGEALCRTLNECGVPTVHCKDLHGEAGTLRNSYAQAGECIKTYLERYPSVRYVIDVHRDGILTSDGACVRAVSGENKEAVAQVMALVGSDGNGTECPSWRSNLTFALQLRDRLNREEPAVCRPVSLKNASYNQEYAPVSLLLEIGTLGNSVQEAIRAAELVGRELSVLILGE